MQASDTPSLEKSKQNIDDLKVNLDLKILFLISPVT